MEREAERQTQSGARLGLGLCCTVVLGGAYAVFLLLSACAPQLLATPVAAGTKMTWAFALGFAIIGLGIFLTWFYAIVANRRERQAQHRALAMTPRVAEIGKGR